MFFKKFNNAVLWKKIEKLRNLIKQVKKFKARKCYRCQKDLNIYDFLSDNYMDYSAAELLALWQNPLLEFYCCECFKHLKKNELDDIGRILGARKCADCEKEMDIYNFSKSYQGLNIEELKDVWLNTEKKVFCSKFCRTHYYKSRH